MLVGISFYKDFIIIIIDTVVFSALFLSRPNPRSFSRFISVPVSHTLRKTNENKEICLIRRLTVSSRVPSPQKIAEDCVMSQKNVCV